MNPPEREITEKEWIAASQACCGAVSDDEGDPARTGDGPAPAPPPSPDLSALPPDN
jgi:hypothetical protein